MTIEHLPLLHRLDTDPEVMRYLLGRARTPEEIDRFWAPRCRDTAADAKGLGWWVGFHEGTFLGWWDLGRSDSTPDEPVSPHSAEIGWRVVRHHWGQGLATEAARALLEHGWETVGLQLVWAKTMAVNAASRGVMRKLGMRHTRTEFPEWKQPIDGSDQGEVIYEITAPERRNGPGVPLSAQRRPVRPVA